MPISAVHWRLVVGYYNRSKLTYFRKSSAQPFTWVIYHYLHNALAIFFHSFLFFLFFLILLSGDVKLNPGPKKRICITISVSVIGIWVACPLMIFLKWILLLRTIEFIAMIWYASLRHSWILLSLIMIEI